MELSHLHAATAEVLAVVKGDGGGRVRPFAVVKGDGGGDVRPFADGSCSRPPALQALQPTPSVSTRGSGVSSVAAVSQQQLVAAAAQQQPVLCVNGSGVAASALQASQPAKEEDTASYYSGKCVYIYI